MRLDTTFQSNVSRIQKRRLPRKQTGKPPILPCVAKQKENFAPIVKNSNSFSWFWCGRFLFWCDVSPTSFQLNNQENQIHFELLSSNHNITTQLSVDCDILLPWVALFQFITRLVEQSEVIRLSIYFIPSWRVQAPAEEWIALFRRYRSVYWPVVAGPWCALSLLPVLLSKQILSDTQQHKFRTFFRQRF